MSLKTKKKPFRFTFKVALRWVIFSAIIYFLISFFSSKKSAIKIQKTNNNSQFSFNINSLYNQIPESNRKKIEDLNKSPAIIFIQTNLDQIKNQTKGFPQNQIKEIKKMVITNVYQDMMKNIDQK